MELTTAQKYARRPDVKLKQAEAHKKWALKNKDKLKAYMKKYRENNKELCLARSRKWYYAHHEENKRKASIANKKPKALKRRCEAMRRFRKRNPTYMSAYSMRYYFANQEKVDKTHAEWTKKAKAKYGSLWKRYGQGKNAPVCNALARARGTKGSIEHQDRVSIRKDIEILKKEIARLRKEWDL